MRVTPIRRVSILADFLQVLGPVRTSWTATSLSTPRTWPWDAASPRPSGSRPRGGCPGCRCWHCRTMALWKSPVTWKAWKGAQLVQRLRGNHGRVSPSAASPTAMFQLPSSRRGSQSWQVGRGLAWRAPRWWGSPPMNAGAWRRLHCLRGSLSSGKNGETSECENESLKKHLNLTEKNLVFVWRHFYCRES